MGILLWPNGEAKSPEYLVSRRTVEDLQLEAVAEAMAFNHYWRLTVQDLAKLWTDDPQVIAYRQDVLRDLMEHPELEPVLESLLDSIDTWETHSSRSARGGEERGQALDLWAFSFLDSFLQRVETVDRELFGTDFRSAGMTAFRDRVHARFQTERFRAAREAFSETCGGYTYPTRITLGFNLNESLKPVSLKLLAVPERGEKGRRLSLTPGAMNTARQVLAKAISDAGVTVSGFVRQESAELRSVKQDIIFYLSALRLKKSWENAGMTACLPAVAPKEQCRFRTRRMFNPLLVIHGTQRIVANDIEFAEGGELLVLTGANQGGKTVFLLSAALTQWLFQLGIAVPCAEAEISPVSQVLTVFAPKGAGTAAARDRGLLAEEAGRIAEAVKGMCRDSMILLNEPLNATSPMENLYISREILGALKAAGARGIWVTHLYELASGRERMNELLPWGSKLGSIRIVVENDGEGTHSTYRIVRGEPEFNSYAAEVMRRRGLDYSREAE